jgi:hypothetical protein
METVALNVPDEILTIRQVAELLKINEKTELDPGFRTIG